MNRLKKGKSDNTLYYCIWIFAFLFISGLSVFVVLFHREVISTTKIFSTNPNANTDISLQIIPEKPVGNKQVNIIQTPSPTYSFEQIHFVHIPKCGGTSMTALLRQIMCEIDPTKNADCCLNPGFCDYNDKRKCNSIKGCINHFPNRKFIFKPIPSITVLRDPIARILSAWFYRGHTPNNDFFQVRPEFKKIRDGLLPKVTFPEYIEMPEYQNIITRMLGADSFPYRNVTITDEVYNKALSALEHFFFIGIQEEYDISSKALLRTMGINKNLTVTQERGQGTQKTISSKKKEIISNKKIMQRLKEVNHYDITLYEKAVERFCLSLKTYPDLYQEVKKNGKIKC